MTVVEAIQWASRKLKERTKTPETGTHLDSPILDAEILLAATLHVTRGWLFTHFDTPLRADEEDRYYLAIRRRMRQEPVAYIIETKSFFTRDFFVNRFVLIPRPATETLVEAAIQISQTSNPEKTLFADIGTGSGAIAVTLAAESGIPVIASDVSRHALLVARQNAATFQVGDRIEFLLGSLAQPIFSLFQKMKEQPPLPFQHLIICANLPYLSEDQWKTGQAELHFEPKIALASGKDGLDAYWELLRSLVRSRPLLPFRVSLLMEIGPSQHTSVPAIIRHHFPQAHTRILQDMEGFDRVVITEI